jgi:hypothetical protein
MSFKSTPVDIDSLGSVTTVNAYRSDVSTFPITHEEDPQANFKRILWDSDDLTDFGILARSTPLLQNVIAVTREIHNRGKFSNRDAQYAFDLLTYGLHDRDCKEIQHWIHVLYRYQHLVQGNFIDRIFLGGV